MKGLFVCFMLLSVGQLFGQQIYWNRYEGQSRFVTISLSDEGEFYFISRPPEAYNPPTDEGIHFLVWYKGVYKQSNDSIVCIDRQKKAKFIFIRLNKDSLEFKGCEGVDKRLSKSVLGNGIRTIVLYEELHRFPLFRHTVKLRKITQDSARVVEWYMWRKDEQKIRVFPKK